MKTTAFFLITAAVALAQPAPPIKSPDVQPNGRVTFRLRAPNAKEVFVSIAGAPQHLALRKDDQGVWSLTTDPLAPDLYAYSFDADGARLLDPNNSQIIPNILSPSNFLNVPGPSPQPWDVIDEPHGAVHQHFYHSAVVGDNRCFFVYTPPGYDPASRASYPVLYLLHGYSDDPSAWTAVGKANLILDTLIAQGKAKRMIVVMPLGYGAPEILHPHGASPFNDPDLRNRNFGRFGEALLTEVVPAVEKSYRVLTDRNSRAIAGLSMGGAESLLTGLNNLDKFSYVGAFSSGGQADDFASEFPKLTSADANKQLHLLWIACGTEDRLITLNRKLVTWLNSKNIRVSQIETPGMHTWMVWRRNLVAFTSLLFQ